MFFDDEVKILKGLTAELVVCKDKKKKKKIYDHINKTILNLQKYYDCSVRAFDNTSKQIFALATENKRLKQELDIRDIAIKDYPACRNEVYYIKEGIKYCNKGATK